MQKAPTSVLVHKPQDQWTVTSGVFVEPVPGSSPTDSKACSRVASSSPSDKSMWRCRKWINGRKGGQPRSKGSKEARSDTAESEIGFSWKWSYRKLGIVTLLSEAKCAARVSEGNLIDINVQGLLIKVIKSQKNDAGKRCYIKGVLGEISGHWKHKEWMQKADSDLESSMTVH